MQHNIGITFNTERVGVMDVIVHKRILGVIQSLRNRTYWMRPFETMALGYDGKPRLIELIALPKKRLLGNLPCYGTIF